MRKLWPSFLLVGLASCSTGSGGDSTAVVAEPLSNHEHCQSTSTEPDFTISTFPMVVTKNPQYGSSLCAKAVIVDVIAPPNTTGWVSIQWGARVPTNATDCANASLWAYSWEMPSQVGLDDLIVNGSWSGGSCSILPLVMPAFRTGTGVNRRYAISARMGSSVQTVGLSTNMGMGGTGPI
jgi:hypothetical protein